MKAPLDDIIERAGVGRVTLFRNFADRDALMMALIDRTLGELEQEATLVDGDPTALARSLRLMTEVATSRAPVIEYCRTLGIARTEIQAVQKRFLLIFEKPITWALANETCRPDLTPRDILLMASMLSGVVHEEPARRREFTDRAWMFVVEMLHLRDARPQALRHQ